MLPTASPGRSPGLARVMAAACLLACGGDDEPGGADDLLTVGDGPTSIGTSGADAGPTGDPTMTDSEDGGTGSAGSMTSASTDSTGGPDCTTVPDPDQPWLAPFLDEVVATLSGQMSLPDGTSLPDRETATNRGKSRDYLVALWDEHGFVGQTHDYGTGSNVFAELLATETSAGVIVLGAHFDSVPTSPGANDNATGVAYVYALARYLADLPCRGVDFLFVLFDEEELGLVGSAAFAQLLVDQATDVISVHTIDQMGWDSDGDRAIELERPDAGLFDLYDNANVAAGLGLTLYQTQTGSTDHVSFRAAGFPAIGLTEEYRNGDTTPHYHQSSDTYSTVDLAYLRSTTILGAHTHGRIALGL